MRCLHCGKELALFKRLTGGGEFCSDAHRQKYQEEYNQLALSRLLQASPVAEGAEKGSLNKSRDVGAPAKELSKKVLEEIPVEVGYKSGGNGTNGSSSTNGSYHFEDDAPAEVHELASDSISYEEDPEYISTNSAEDASTEEEAPAAPSGFLVELFQPHFSLEPAIAIVESDFVWNERPAFPENEMVAVLEARPGFAGVVSLETSLSIHDFRGNTRAPAVEVREMGRGVVNVNADFPEVIISGLSGTNRPMEFSLKSCPPQDPPLFWEEPAKEFGGFETELGDLARLAFVTLGWDEIAKNEGLAGQQIPAPAPKPAVPVAAEPELSSAAVPTNVEEAVKGESGPTVEELAAQDQVQEPEQIQEEPVDTTAPSETPGALMEEAEEPVAEEEQAAESIPAAITKPLPMTLHGHAPGRGKPVQVFPSAIARTAGIQIPRPQSMPLRPTMVFGAAPASPTPVAAPVVAPVVAKEKTSVAPEPIKREAAPAPVTKKEASAPSARPDIKTLIKPAVQVKKVELEKRESEKKESEKKDVEKTTLLPAASVTAEKTKPQAPEARKTEERKAEVRKVEDRKAEERKVEERKVEERKVEERKAEERKAEERKAEERKPEAKEEPVRKEVAPVAPEFRAKKEPLTPKAPPLTSTPSDIDLGLPSLGMERSQQGFWSKLPVFAKASVGAALLVAVAGAYLYSTRHDAADSAAQRGPVVVAAGNVLSSGGAGWDTDWAPDPPSSKRQRRISLMHASQSLSDYRMELEGQIETKAMGWVFRASNPKNFYVEKIEIVKPGLNPKIQLVRFAVIDGVEQPHQNVPLTVPVRPDTVYKIRFEAIGDRFTTWLLDQKVDEWTDSHIASGGVGLYAESGESLSMKGGLNVVPLVVKR